MHEKIKTNKFKRALKTMLSAEDNKVSKKLGQLKFDTSNN